MIGCDSGNSTLPRLLRPGVFQSDGAIEYELALAGGWGLDVGIGVEGEVAEALELVAEVGVGVDHRRFALGGDDFEAVRVEVLLEVAFGIGLRHGKETVI